MSRDKRGGLYCQLDIQFANGLVAKTYVSEKNVNYKHWLPILQMHAQNTNEGKNTFFCIQPKWADSLHLLLDADSHVKTSIAQFRVPEEKHTLQPEERLQNLRRMMSA